MGFLDDLKEGQDAEGQAPAADAPESKVEGGEPKPAGAPSPDPSADEIAALRRQVEEQRSLLFSALTNQANAYSSNVGGQTEVEEKLDDLDEREKRLLRAVEKSIDDKIRPIVSSYSSNRANDASRTARQEVNRVTSELVALGLGAHVKDVQAYLANTKIDPEYLAQDGGADTLVASVLGMKLLEEKRQAARRAPSLGSNGARSGIRGDEEYADDNQIRNSVGDGEVVDKVKWLAKHPAATIDEYRAFRQGAKK